MGDLDKLEAALVRRFGEEDAARLPASGLNPMMLEALTRMTARGSARKFRPDPVDLGLVKLVAAAAFSAPTKSDLQQRDLIIIQAPDQRAALNALLETQPWAADAPLMLVICGNHRRQRRLHELRGREFVNDHLDAFFNAAVDGGVLLSALVTAAEAVGLGCCPVSAIRNHSEEASKLLNLPELVFPVAALALGWPSETPEISPRLPLSATLHLDHYNDDGEAETIEAYDARRHAVQPYGKQRFPKRYGVSEAYGWSEDKARQYAAPERAGFGAFVRDKGFKLC